MVFPPEWFIVFRLFFVFDATYRLPSFFHQAFCCNQVFHGIDFHVLIVDLDGQDDFPVVNAALQIPKFILTALVVICVTLKF